MRLQRLQRRARSSHGSLPKWLQFGKGLFANMAGFAPAVTELVEQTGKALPVFVQGGGVGGSPLFDFVDHGQALRPVLHRLGLHFVQPGLDHLVRIVTCLVETFPQTVVGYTTLISLLPFFTQSPQQLLHLAPTYALAFGPLEQAFGLGHQRLAQLVGAPALPALQLASCRQRRMG